MIEIRPADDRDRHGIAELIRAWRPETSEWYATGIGNTSVGSYVATVDGKVVGWIDGHHDSDAWGHARAHAEHPVSWKCSYVIDMFVAPASRRAGVGRGLLEAFAEEGSRLGNTLVLLTPRESEDMQDAGAFFRSCGFEPVESAAEYEGRGPWLMGRSLDPADAA